MRNGSRRQSTLPAASAAGALAAIVIAACGSGATTGSSLIAGQDVAVALEPPSATVPINGQVAFDAIITGTTLPSVTWELRGTNCGTIVGGLYSAPAQATICQVVAVSVADPTKSAASDVTVRAVDTLWEPLKVGAGGYVTGIDFDDTGTTSVLRTDTHGAYVGDGTGAWQQVVRADTLPPSLVSTFATGTRQVLAEGVYEIRVAPSDRNRLYMTFKSRVYRSNNRGGTWIESATFPTVGTLDPNDSYRTYGEKMAVDPANEDVVFVGAGTSGLFVTADGGATWTAVTGLATPGVQGITGITFDRGSGTTGSRTNTIYACVNGTGVYRTTNAGATWSLLAGSPTTAVHASIASDGVYYVANGGNVIYRYMGGSWSASASVGQTMYTVAADPSNPARVVAGRDSGHLAVSTDHGTTWILNGIISWTMKRQATDVPWLAMANESYMSSGATRFDPMVPNKLWFTEGIGVWYTTDPASVTQTTWTSRSAGIEQLVGRDVAVPPGSASVITAGMDRSLFVVPRTNASYASQYVTMGSSNGLIAAWSVDYSRANPSHLVAIINRGLAGEPEVSGYSLDAGATWTKFPVQPGAGGQCGDIVAPSIDNIIAVIGTKYAYRSTDRGASWAALTLPGDGGANTSNLHAGYNTKKHILAVDGADPHTVYLYFYTRGVYKSSDDGASWTLVSSNAFDAGNMYWQAKLRSVPGQAGHLFLTAGQAGGDGQQNPAATSLWRSTNGGATWTTVPGIGEPYDVALGKAAAGQSYPTIYVVGWYNRAYGIWRSTDNAVSWTDIGPFPFSNIDEVNVIKASQDVFGDVYVAFQGSGWGYGHLAP